MVRMFFAGHSPAAGNGRSPAARKKSVAAAVGVGADKVSTPFHQSSPGRLSMQRYGLINDMHFS
jgi:hypothetical protein